MNRPPLIPPRDPAGPKRPQIDRTALEAAIADQVQRDAEHEPVSLLTTMGAVRMMKSLILERKDLGWTDAMLVAWMRELDVEISAETLRVYRSRLKREGAGPSVLPVAAPRHPPGAASAPPSAIATEAPQTQSPPPSPARKPPLAAGPSETEAAPRFNKAVDLDDCV